MAIQPKRLNVPLMSGQSNSGSTNSNPSTITTQATDMVYRVNDPTSAAGNFEITKFLYDSGLQNIFNDYQANVATLNQNQQQDLQDAYYIREMSKKYLGEYASNVGMGDVSGNLLDIYGQYQQNVGAINQNYNQLELGLQSQYQQAQQQAFEGILQAQANRQVQQLDENAQSLVFNITSGNVPEGMSQWDYLSSELAAGRITEKDYRDIYNTLYAQGLTTVGSTLETGLASGYFGTDDNGNKINNALDYLAYAEEKYNLTPEDMKLLTDKITAIELGQEQGLFEVSYFNVPGLDNENFDANISPTNYSPLADSNSILFKIYDNEYVSVGANVDSESEQAFFDEMNVDVDTGTLNEYYYDRNEGKVLGIGSVMFHEPSSTWFVYGKDGRWHRSVLTQGPSATASVVSDRGNTWFIPKENALTDANGNLISANGDLRSNGKDVDTVVIGATTYEPMFKDGGKTNDNQITISTSTTSISADLTKTTIKNSSGQTVVVQDIINQALTQFGKENIGELLAMTNTFVVAINGHFFQVYKSGSSLRMRALRPQSS